ncbi:MAG: acylphosphatase [Calditrichaeota bacterium]|nr:acylphosphatase [Calditrichota bacterium]
MDRVGVYVRVFGMVQGVGYRFFTQRKAREYGLVGYVRNMPDGSVEVYAEGDREVLENFLLDLRRGPVMARVDDMRVEWREASGRYRDFSITF